MIGGVPVGTPCRERVSPQKCAQMAAIMNWPAPLEGETLPPLWHWLFCAPAVSHRDLGHDGHELASRLDARLDGLHRMWAAGEVTFLAPIPIGAELVRQTQLDGIVQKKGRSGALVFATLRHAWRCDGRDAIDEVQTLVYRASPGGADARVADPGEDDARMPSQLDDLQLFRYSALTFNSHRIHLDRSYCAENHGSPRLVAHAPLQATILARAATAQAGPLASFSFRALSPLREGDGFAAVLDGAAGVAQIRNSRDALCMEARFRSDMGLS